MFMCDVDTYKCDVEYRVYKGNSAAGYLIFHPLKQYSTHIYLLFCGPAYAMTNAVQRRTPKTTAVTQSARFCEQTATPFRV